MTDTRDLVAVQSYSGRRGAYRGNPNHSIVMSVRADASDRLILKVKRPGRIQKTFRIGDLLSGGHAVYTGPYPAECMLIHRPVARAASTLSGQATLHTGGSRSYVYLRVRQQNGQMAWSSPVFMNYG